MGTAEMRILGVGATGMQILGGRATGVPSISVSVVDRSGVVAVVGVGIGAAWLNIAGHDALLTSVARIGVAGLSL